QSNEIGGQFNLAKRIPGKGEYAEPMRYWGNLLDELGVDVRLGKRADAAILQKGNFDAVIIATGVTPRAPRIPGQDHPMVVGYRDAIAGDRHIGKRVAIVGAGGIGFDVANS